MKYLLFSLMKMQEDISLMQAEKYDLQASLHHQVMIHKFRLSWEAMLDDISTIKIGMNTTEASIGADGKGFKELDSTYQKLYQKINTATDYTEITNMKYKLNYIAQMLYILKYDFIDSHVQDTGTSEGVAWVGKITF